MGSPSARRSCSAVLVVLALVLASCQTAPSPTTVGTAAASTQPGPNASPVADAKPSSQALIAADLEAGTIDAGTALQYRAWALFGDARLPEKYDRSGSSGEDNELFNQIAASADTLPAAQAADLKRYLLRPTDPMSAWGRPGTARSTGISLAAVEIASESESQLCAAPNGWEWEDWSPDGSADRGFRIWACGQSKDAVQADLNAVIGIGSRLWGGMTYAEPDGMGLPMPDLGALQNDGNGKVDVYLLDRQAECKVRGGCVEIPAGVAVAAAVRDRSSCAVQGFPEHGCSAYMLLARERLRPTPSAPDVGKDFPADFAHEFFHVLQMTHNSVADWTWYHEASAVWAEFMFERESAQRTVYRRFSNFQTRNLSLLYYQYGSFIQYDAWGWPLFQSIEEGPSNVFQTWVAAEDATLKSEIDAAVDEQLAFSSEFRNFMVRNAQPAAYIYGSSTGLEADRWQTDEDIRDFPLDEHKLTNQRSVLALGKSEYPANIDPLAAAFDEYEVVGDKIRQIEIDISKLSNADNADLDVLAQIRSKSGDTWTRFTGRDGKVKLCRDVAAEDVNTVLALVISNHAVARAADSGDPEEFVSGNYTIESKDKCDERELHLGGRITWNAAITDELVGTQSVSGTADVVIHVTESRLIAELEDHSTYSYDFTGPPDQCASSHEAGTLDTLGREYGPAGPLDYSGGMLIVDGWLGQDIRLHLYAHDYCGPSMGDSVSGTAYGVFGFPFCEQPGFVTARFDGVQSYVIDCDVIGWGGGSAPVSGHFSGVLRLLDGPHPTPPYRR